MQPIPIAGRRDSKINVLEVIGNANVGGMESYIKNFIAKLPKDQFRVTCICPYESRFTGSLRELEVEDLFVTPMDDDPSWRSIQLTTEVAKLHQIDVIHAHMPKAHVLAGIAGCLTYKPVVATVHGMDVTSHELGIIRSVGSNIITNCQEAYIQALAMGVPSKRVDLIRNGVDIDVFNPSNSGKRFRESINVSEDALLVGYVGRLDSEKGPDLFLLAAEHVHRHLPDVHFVMVGEGAMQKQLIEMNARMNFGGNLHFVGWQAKTADIYPALDLLAHTSRSDGTSLVLLEAMACACPTIGLSVGGAREIIEYDSTGLTASAGDWEGFGVQMVRLLEKPERLLAMGKAARCRVEQHFNLATNTRLTSEVLTKLAIGLNVQRFGNSSTLSNEIDVRVSLDNSKGVI